MNLLRGRLGREHRTLERMVVIHCRDHHGADGGTPCPDCRELLRYAARRLEKCPYGSAKPVCTRCPIHCYKRAPREQVRGVMRYAGPRMLLRHPWLALAHLADKLRRVEHPGAARRRERAAREGASPSEANASRG